MRKRTGYLVRRGKVFYACWHVGGKLFMRTTKKRDRREAEKELNRIMEPFVAGDEIVTLQNIAAKIEGRTAELTRLEDERNPPLPVSAAWNTFLVAPGRPDSGPGTLSHYEGQFAAFADWLKRTHPDATALQDVTASIAGEYAAHLTNERTLSANSFNKHVRVLELLFRVLKEPARLSVNPWEGVQRKRAMAMSRRELTTDELKAVCAAASGEMRLLFALGIYTGLRRGDCATLRWAEVDLPRRIIRRVPGKIARRNPRPVIIPIHPTLSAILTEARNVSESEFVLPETAAQYAKNPQGLSRRIQDHFTACNIRTVKPGTGFITEAGPDGKPREVSTGKRAVVEVGFHSLRHSFVSLCRESNAPLAVVEAIVGHSNPAMTRHYTHVSELAAAHAVNGLPSVMGDAPALPPVDPIVALRANVRTLADKLNSKTWKMVKDELNAIAAG